MFNGSPADIILKLPVKQRLIVTNLRTWLYRKDKFEKHNLEMPETLDGLYETAVTLKKLYPESYPICLRTGLSNVAVIGPQWKPYFSHLIYYDYDNDKWNYGAAEPTMLEIVEYFIKLYREKLVPPDYLTINSKSWEELISTDRGFMVPEYVVRIDYFNVPNREANPEFTLAAMRAPRANTPTGQNKVAKFNMDPTGYVICNTGSYKRVEFRKKRLGSL